MKDMQLPELQIRDGIIKGLRLLEPSCYHDFRGYYWTVYNKKNRDLQDIVFNHDKVTVSREGTLRGIHGDFSTLKMVSCLYGEVYCVIVDKREESDTYDTWYWAMLTHTNRKSILIPPGVGLAYYVMSPEATVLYKLAYDGEYKDVKDQFTYKWNDPSLSIFWPTNSPILQKRDSQ
tara:strand:- start:747 stop:1274 length:528 start_codon:yes stop_codon:yes gene_type:complete